MYSKCWDKSLSKRPKPPRPEDNNIIEGISCSWEKDCIHYKQLERIKNSYIAKTNFLKWLLKQQYYIIPKNIKLKIKEIFDYDERTME